MTASGRGGDAPLPVAPHDDGLYAAEASGHSWFNDPEGGWTELGEVEARELAIDPMGAKRQIAPDYEARCVVGAPPGERRRRANSPLVCGCLELQIPRHGPTVGKGEQLRAEHAPAPVLWIDPEVGVGQPGPHQRSPGASR